MIGFYVTLKDAKRTAWLLGPFVEHTSAKAAVASVVAKATEIDPWCHFYAFGTSSIATTTSDKPLPLGRLNHLLPDLLATSVEDVGLFA